MARSRISVTRCSGIEIAGEAIEIGPEVTGGRGVDVVLKHHRGS